MKTFIKTQLKKSLIMALLLALSIITFSQDIDTLQINNPTESDIDTNREARIESTAVDSQKSPLLYNRFIGIIMDETAFVIPLAFFFTKAYWEPHNNILVYMCAYPVGVVFIEKFVKNMFVHPPNFASRESHSYISVNGQFGVITPTSAVSSEFSPPNIDVKGFYRAALEYEYQLNSSFGIQIQGEYLGSTGYLTGDYLYRFFGYSVGLRFTDWYINVNKILFGYSFINAESKEYGSDFWGFGIGWSKRYYPYKGLFIEPDISYRFSRTADYSVSIIGLFIGGKIGVKFN
jgi:hypothetical protein